jgi:hypothetical protein
MNFFRRKPKHVHQLVRVKSNHLHFVKGEHETTTYCFNGILEVCRFERCHHERFIGNPALYVVGCAVRKPEIVDLEILGGKDDRPKIA